jgi:YggT family protein
MIISIVTWNIMLVAIASIYFFVWYLIVIAMTFTIALLSLRLIFNWADVNPFTWHAMTTRRLSDPFVNPIQRALRSAGRGPKYAPLVAIVFVLIAGLFTLEIIAGILNTVAGVYLTATLRDGMAVIGYLLYGMLMLYGLMIFMRMLVSWGPQRHGNRVMRFVINATDPLLIPLRRRIRPVGMFDVSPMIAFLIVWALQALVQATLLRGLPLHFVG